MEEVATMPSNAQEFCLRWNNFHSSLISALDGFKNDLDFVDVTLACEGQFLKAHKMLLSACSVFFRDLLKANPCQHPIVILPPEVRFIDLEKMLRFIYQGEVNVHQENLARFLKTAEMLKIRGLAEDNEKQKVLQASSPRPSESNGADRLNDSSSPKRPRLSIDAQSGSLTDHPPTPSDDRLSGADSDSEMIPVKQEMIELKECDFESADNETFLAENYLQESSSATSSNNNSSSTQPQTHPAAPPPPGPLLPSYVPPPQVKAQDDSSLTSNQEDISQDWFLPIDGIEGGLGGSEGASSGVGDIYGLDYSNIGGSVIADEAFDSDMGGITSCPVCFKSVQVSYLTLHLKRIHSSIEVSCPLCLKVFKNKHSLGVHQARYHPRNISRPHIALSQQQQQQQQPHHRYNASSSHQTPAHFSTRTTTSTSSKPLPNTPHSTHRQWSQGSNEDDNMISRSNNTHETTTTTKSIQSLSSSANAS